MLEHYFVLERIVLVRIKGEDKKKRIRLDSFIPNFAREKIYILPVE